MLSIQFEKLFGRFDYSVPLNEGGLTIITGPNGFGKTTILKSIKALSQGIGGLLFFVKLDFERLFVRCEDGSKDITIENFGDKLLVNGIDIKKEDLQKRLADMLLRRAYFTRIDENTWFDRRRGTRVKFNDSIIDWCIKEIQNLGDEEIKALLTKKWTSLHEDLKQAVGEIFFIQEQRLIREGRNRHEENEIINVIEELPGRFRNLMSNVQQEYSRVANGLDSTYPNRLFKTDEGLEKSDYAKKMQEMSLKFKALSKYDLSALQEPAEFTFKEEHAKALKVYFEDFEIKYRVYEDFIKKLDLYTDIINNRLLFKTIKISKENGISVVDGNDKELPLNQLSSGEKQEIVLFYDLIFNTKANILLFIDEPELSLHIIWQKIFIDDLLRIINYKRFKVIVATHSPQIISNHWDKQIDLGELYGRQLD